MKVSVIISACDNRESFFVRSLYSWSKQTLSKDDFEIIVVDDAERQSFEEICIDNNLKYGINFQYIRFDKNKNKIIPKTFIPVLSNNIGIKQSRGEVIVITGPETLQNSKNLETSLTAISRKECLYGLVFKADLASSKYIEEFWEDIKNSQLIEILQIPGAQAECLTRPPHPPAYAYFIAVKKQHAIDIGGFDEKFLNGLCGEDDDFANRMRMFGVIPTFEHKILGLHQNHSSIDKKDNIHLDRNIGIGKKLRDNNIKILQENLKNKTIVVNKDYDWGNKNLITYHRIIGEK